MVIRTLVVDDDYRVADVNAAYVEKVAGFEVVGLAHTAAATMEAIHKHRPDLVLLDLYLPDQHGLELMREIQAMPRHPDVMVISAARDVESVRTAMQQGAVHYLVKPFSSERLTERLRAYSSLQRSLRQLGEASQEDVDRLYALMRSPVPPRLPKGHSEPTMTRILEAIRASGEELTAAELADRVGVSRPTAQRYLAHLVREGLVQLHLRYGAAGRPSHRYRAARP